MGAGATCPCACPERVGEASSQADTVAIIVAGGIGQRFGDPRGKQYVELCGLPIICWSLVAFDRAPSVSQIIVVCAPDKAAEVEKDFLPKVRLTKRVTLAPSGATRQDSVASGLAALPRDCDFVAVHDAARPLVETELIERCIACVREDRELAGAILAHRAIDTLKLVEGTDIVATPNRSFYWCAQTPQVFRTRAIVSAYKAAAWDDFQGTDDASLVERHGGKVRCVESPRDNIKVTIPADLAIAEATLEQRLVDAGCGTEGEGCQ